MFKGIALMLLGCGILTAGDALMKSLVSGLPVAQTVGLRAIFAMATVLVLAPMVGGYTRLKAINPGSVLLVSGLLVFNLFAFPASLRYMPLADAIILAYTSPIWVVALAPLLLKEQVRWQQWIAVLLGFAGAAFIIKPGGTLHWAVILPLIVGLTVGLRDIVTRQIAARERSLSIVFYANAMTLIAGLLALPFGWVPVDAGQWTRLAIAGVFLSVSQIMMIEGFRLVEASVLSTIKYSSVLFAALFGYLFWGELFDLPGLIGAILIIFSGILIVHFRQRPTSVPADILPRNSR